MLPKVHTMEDSLFKYIDIKIHPKLKAGLYKRIIVRASTRRISEGVSPLEKRDKLLNWKRPSLENISKEECYYNCFPGKDYVFHYFKLLKTFYEINRIKSPKKIEIQSCTSQETFQALVEDTNLSIVPKSDIYILGIVNHFFAPNAFVDEGDFIWKQERINQKNIVYLGCKFSIWGNIAGEVSRFLAKEKQAKQIIYIGKLGGLKEEFIPNTFLCVGNMSLVEGRNIYWNNLFADIKDDNIVAGKHITVPSIIQETKSWLRNHENSFDFVDPEIGQMALACYQEGVDFSYLHIISDNLKKKYDEDLSNERKLEIISKRNLLYLQMRNILARKNLYRE